MSDNILVLGRAKTGTTFVHAAIADSAPGAARLRTFEPSTLRQLEVMARKAAGRPVLAKILHDHWAHQKGYPQLLTGPEAPVRFNRVVAMVRDPRDELLSRLLYLPYGLLWEGRACPGSVKRWAEVLAEKEARPEAVSLMDLLEKFASIFGEAAGDLLEWQADWARDYLQFLRRHGHGWRQVRYEEAVDGKFGTLSDYLGFAVSPVAHLGRQAHTMRTGAYGSWRRVMLPSDIEPIRDALGTVCEQWGYADWELAADKSLDPAHYSGYTRKLLATFSAKHGGLRVGARRLRQRFAALLSRASKMRS